ncbi:MAG: ABC transporter substrate-binding protein [Clostridiales Family XIII bacterium]|jgi:ABC-type nitrate/sulfonate/bicarbonate transport system substrate-binding protein|nr:ABC transporter substrate-binding protein [Clostridiales Family XIII bacterium]
MKTHMGTDGNFREYEAETQGFKAAKRKIRTASAAVLLALAFALSACGGAGNSGSGNGDGGGAGGGGETGAEDTEYVFKIASLNTSATSLDSASVGLAKGFFEEEGVILENAGDISVPQYTSALLQGSLDAILLMTSDGVAAIDNGADIVSIAGGMDVTEEKPHMIYVVLEDSPLQYGDDISGKKVGIAGLGGCLAGFPLEYARQIGVADPKGELELIVSPENTLVDSLRAGTYDFVGLHLLPEQLETIYPGTRILFTDYDLFGDKGGDIDWYVKRSLAEENPDAVRAFVAGVAKTNNWINENTEEALEFYKGLPAEVNEEFYHTAHFAEDGLLYEDHIQTWIDLFSTGTNIQELVNKDLTPADVFTNEYNPYYKQ